MGKKLALGTLVVFVVWEIRDFFLHGVLLQSTYARLGNLMRPQEEVKMGVLVLVVFISALAFTYIYGRLVSPHSRATALQYALWFGIATGIGMGYGSHATMPIPYSLALGWFLGTIVEALAAGFALSFIFKESPGT